MRAWLTAHLARHTRRTLAKTLSFAVVHFAVAFTVAYWLTGSIVTGGLIALIEPACNTVAYFFHERLWQKFGTPPTPAKGYGHGNLFQQKER
ncbi:DUF2061 domain-containing protein [Halopseudomonas nanhaiensis]|uniref:DUF2061 domain-containing protein n=1 Tax=Halopseudomonas nanhaiensis TaxID=2830842 RepID=UPI001CBEA5A7|nr:DUF2061 domain-containing protein [Halopseudomonas nanhaiensis]UAW97509.1 DUF2061 domain-containing protein [Halopseudomonas nanhaiensis]